MQNSSNSAPLVRENKHLNRSRPLSALRYTQPRSAPPQLHLHDCLELGRCVSGSGVMMIDRQIRTFSPGSITVIPAGCIHDSCIPAGKDGAASEWELIFTDPAALGLLRSGVHPTVTEDGEVQTLFSLLFREAEKRPSLWQERSAHLLGALLITLRRLSPPAPEEADKIPEEVARAMHRITAGYAQSLSVEQLARECCMSVSTFERMFRRSTGVNPSVFLRRTRIAAARHMLLNTGKSVLEIAGETGYGTLSTFNRAFRAETGVSPGQYRRQSRAKRIDSPPQT